MTQTVPAEPLLEPRGTDSSQRVERAHKQGLLLVIASKRKKPRDSSPTLPWNSSALLSAPEEDQGLDSTGQQSGGWAPGGSGLGGSRE